MIKRSISGAKTLDAILVTGLTFPALFDWIISEIKDKKLVLFLSFCMPINDIVRHLM